MAAASKEIEALGNLIWELEPRDADPDELFDHLSDIRDKLPGRAKPLARKIGVALERWEGRPVALSNVGVPAHAVSR
jgi:hypothetical protein